MTKLTRGEHHQPGMLDTTSLDSIVRVIQSSLTPIFLLTAVAGLLGVFTTRLARVSDQVKALADLVTGDSAADRSMMRRLAFLRRRSHALDVAVILGSVAGASTCGTVLALFLGLLRAKATGSLLFLLFGIAILCTIGALGAFLTEVLLASRGIRADVRNATPNAKSNAWTGSQMIVVHHLEHSRSQRIVWLLEQLGVPYEIKLYKRNPKTMLAPPELRAVHPLGKAPIVRGRRSGAHRIRRHHRSPHSAARDRQRAEAGAGHAEHVAYSTFLHFAEGSMMPPLLLRLIFTRMNEMSPGLLRPLVRAISAPVNSGFIEPNITRTLDFLEAELRKRPWFAGDAFTGADIQMSFPAEMAQQRGGLNASRPKLMGFLARIRAMPAYQRAKAKIGE